MKAGRGGDTGLRPIWALAAILVMASASTVPAVDAATAPGGEPAAGFGKNSKDPVVIEADQGIEWRQKQQVYVARGNARAIRGDVAVRADTLTAHYRETEKGKTDVWQVVAEGGVIITSKDRRIEGDRGIYNVDTGVFRLTGKALRLETPQETVTARDSLEYRSREHVALIVGNAVAVRDGKRIRADRFVARFAEDQTGRLNLSRVNATGNVIITTPNEIARADRGVYNAATGIATLTGSVKLTRGDNQMNGARAEVDLNKGVSRLLAGPGSGGRVRGLFVPGRKGGDLNIQLPDIRGKTGEQ